MKMMIKSVDREDFSEKQIIETSGSVVYKLDFGDMPNIIEEAKKNRDIVEITDYSELNEREHIGRHDSGPEDSEDVRELLTGDKKNVDI